MRSLRIDGHQRGHGKEASLPGCESKLGERAAEVTLGFIPSSREREDRGDELGPSPICLAHLVRYGRCEEQRKEGREVMGGCSPVRLLPERSMDE